MQLSFVKAATVVAGIALGAPALCAQAFPAITPGTRLRVSAPAFSPLPIAGKLRAVSGDSVYVAKGRDAATGIPIGTIQWVDRSDGKRMNWVGLGAVAGAVVGGAIVWNARSPERGGAAGGAVAGLDGLGIVIAGPLFGAVAGACVGYVLAPRSWTRIQLR
jgi:hypothetical protein